MYYIKIKLGFVHPDEGHKKKTYWPHISFSVTTVLLEYFHSESPISSINRK